MKNTGDFHYKGKPSRATAKSTLLAVSKDEWDTKEDTPPLYCTYSVSQKAPLRPKQCQTVKNQARSLISRYQVTLV